MKLSRKYLLGILAVLAAVSLPLSLYTTTIDAAALTSLQDTLGDSRPSVDADHEIQFVTSSGVAVDETVTLTLDDSGDAFDLTSLDYSDMDLAVDTDGTPGDCSGTLTDETLAATATASDWGVNVNTTTDVITFTAPSSGTPVAAASCVVIEIGENADGGGANESINNPGSAAIYDIDVAGTFGDTGTAKVVVVDTITASVTVDETLTFTVAGVNSGSCTDGDITTTATTIPFGSVNSDTFYDGCQSLTVSTNSSSGYTVTISESDQLTSGASDVIADGSCDGTCSETSAAAWATGTNNGFGYCLQDISGTDANSDWSSNQCDDGTPFYKIFPELDTDTPDAQSIMSNAGSVSGSNIHVGYRVTVGGSQESGTYTNNVILVATPKY